MTTIFGPDISNNNGVVDIGRVAAEGFDFVFAKVSEGSGFSDRFWPRTRDWCAQLGLICVGYHYIRTDNANAQAAVFANNGGGDMVMFDFEAGSGNISNFWACVNAFNARGIRVVLSYIPRWYWQSIGSPDISNIPGLLIQSSYVVGGRLNQRHNLAIPADEKIKPKAVHYSNIQPHYRAGFASAMYPGDDNYRWTGFGGHNVDILQFTDAASIAGLSMDANAYRGTKQDLATALGLAPPANGDNELDANQAKMLEDIHFEITNRFPSRSKYFRAWMKANGGDPDAPIDTLVGFGLNSEGKLNDEAVERNALMGDKNSIAVVKLLADSGDTESALVYSKCPK